MSAFKLNPPSIAVTWLEIHVESIAAEGFIALVSDTQGNGNGLHAFE